MDNYISLQKSQLLDSLENQVRFSQLVAVLVGEKGIGKSFTLDCLQNRLEEEVSLAHIDASIEIQEEQLQKVICMQLGIHSDPDDSFEQIESNIRSSLRKKALITIDNAHLLSNACLNSLLLLNQKQINHQESVLFLLLAGDESLPKNISFTDTFKKHQEMCVVFQLEPIEKAEVSSLVGAINQLELEQVDKIYGEKQLDYFWQLSKGIPAELEYQISRWNSEQAIEDVPDVVKEPAPNYGKALVYLVVAGLFSIILFYQDEINDLITPSASEKDSVKEQAPSKVNDNTLNNTPALVKKNKKKTKILEEQNENKGYISDKNKIEDKQKPPVLNQAQATQLSSDIPLKNKENQKLDNEKENVIVANEQVTNKTKQTTNLEKTPKPTVPSKKITSKNRYTADENFLLSQPNTASTLQWIGVSQLSNAENFKNTHPLKSELYIYKRKQGGNSYLFLVVGDIHTNHQNASLAKTKYKQMGYKGSPWVKSLSAVQKEIKSQ